MNNNDLFSFINIGVNHYWAIFAFHLLESVKRAKEEETVIILLSQFAIWPGG